MTAFDTPNQARAHAEYDLPSGGVKVAILPRPNVVRQWPMSYRRVLSETDAGVESPPEDWLRLDLDEARALYEALSKYFGHDAVSTTALRRDYMAERDRVDRMISHLTGGAR